MPEHVRTRAAQKVESKVDEYEIYQEAALDQRIRALWLGPLAQQRSRSNWFFACSVVWRVRETPPFGLDHLPSSVLVAIGFSRALLFGGYARPHDGKAGRLWRRPAPSIALVAVSSFAWQPSPPASAVGSFEQSTSWVML